MAEAQPEGRRVASRYHLLEAIGRGGMGIVWRAHDEFLDREVAIKEVRYADMLGEDNQEDFNRRTKREARAAGRLTHPNVVVVHDVVEEDGRPWIVMQLVESRSLGKVMRQDGPLSPKRVAEIGLQLLDALRAAHAQGVLHRDVKPENVLLADDGRVVLTDFGIATLEAETALTMTGIAGTPAFIPPERIKGATAQRESDLWSLGATLYAAVEGKPPHDRGGALPTMHAILNDEPEHPVNAGRLAPVLEGLLRKDPALRMSYDEAERLLRAVAEGEPKQPRQPRQPAKTSVMPAVMSPSSTSATAETDPGIQFRAEGFPATGAKLGVAVPAPPKPPVSPPPPREEPREPAAKAPAEEVRQRPASETERKPAPPEAVSSASPARPETAPPARQSSVPAPRPEPKPPARPAPGGRPNPFPPIRQPVPAPRPEPVAPSKGYVSELSSDGAGTEDPSFQRMMTATSRNVPRAPMKRGLLVVLPALLIVGVVAGWLGLRSGQTTEDQGTGSSQARPSVSDGPNGATGSTGSNAPSGPAETTPESTPEQKPSPSPSPSPTKTKEKEESALPAGWHMHKDGNGFSVGLPKGWYVERRNGNQVRFRSPSDSVSYLMIEYVDKGGSDPKKDWEQQEPYSRGNFPGYKRIRIEKVDYMVKAADWEFTWNVSAGKARVINRGFIAKKGGRGYAIYWHTLAADWKKNLPLFEGFAQTFSSKK
ncbi:protein kinase [Streptosporangium subroseum]|uniref:serine/threonine-protein kinase n=1 Tax=Streptosporangium subroseum TaxID=106412 RepID=UPI00343474FF